MLTLKTAVDDSPISLTFHTTVSLNQNGEELREPSNRIPNTNDSAPRTSTGNQNMFAGFTTGDRQQSFVMADDGYNMEEQRERLAAMLRQQNQQPETAEPPNLSVHTDQNMSSADTPSQEEESTTLPPPKVLPCDQTQSRSRETMATPFQSSSAASSLPKTGEPKFFAPDSTLSTLGSFPEAQLGAIAVPVISSPQQQQQPPPSVTETAEDPTKPEMASDPVAAATDDAAPAAATEIETTLSVPHASNVPAVASDSELPGDSNTSAGPAVTQEEHATGGSSEIPVENTVGEDPASPVVLGEQTNSVESEAASSYSYDDDDGDRPAAVVFEEELDESSRPAVVGSPAVPVGQVPAIATDEPLPTKKMPPVTEDATNNTVADPVEKENVGLFGGDLYQDAFPAADETDLQASLDTT